ncbi:MAG: caspase family protein [Pseudomonadota bacterium]
MKRLLALALALGLLTPGPAAAQDDLFGKSYALVIGIGNYPAASGFEKLTYPRKDAGGMAAFLQAQGFVVTVLFDEQATRRAILSHLEDQIVGRLGPDDRVLVFYSGHGQTRKVGQREYGYIIPYDAGTTPSSWIGMDVLRSLSDMMGEARHQLFIMDACYGGQIGLKSGGPGVSLDHPDYVRAVAERPARQFMTAGGADQQVLDGGPDDYSYFTGYLLEALEVGIADLNGDSYITASELGAYITPRASTWNQTPAFGSLPGHGQGEFLFRVPGYRIASKPGAVDAQGNFKGGDIAQPPPPDPAPDPPPPDPLPPDPLPPDQLAMLPGPEAVKQLEQALEVDYDESRQDFYRFLQAESSQDQDTRRVVDILVSDVREITEEGWVVSLQYYVLNRSRQTILRRGRFLVQPSDRGVDFLEAY